MINNIVCFLLVFSLSASTAYADLDDGMGLDDAIDDSLDFKSNIQYIKRNALSKAARGTAIVTGCQGAGNQVIGPGANLNNATIVNLSNNKKTSSLCEKDNPKK